MKVIFVDTSVFYGFIDKDDNNHRTCVELFERVVKNKWELITTNFIVAETHALILSRLGRDKALEWLQAVPGVIVKVTIEDEKKAIKLIKQYSDKDFSYCDATSFVVINRLGINYAMSMDRHFRQYGKFTILNL